MKSALVWCMGCTVGASLITITFGVIVPVAVGCAVVSCIVCTGLWIWIDRNEKY